MAHKFIIDFVYDQKTGIPSFYIDFQDDSMTMFEITQAVRDGEVRQEVLSAIENLFGNALRQQVEGGEIPLICLDDHPEEKPNVPIAISQEDPQTQTQGKTQAW